MTKLSLGSKELERKELSLMFTDIVGYSKLMGQDEQLAIELLESYRRIALVQIANHDGTVIEFIGDAVFARFNAPLDAVRAGLKIQNELAKFNLDNAFSLPALHSRIGIHHGEVNISGEGLFGDDVNIAARLEPIAIEGGLCVSEKVYTQVKDEINVPVKALGVQPLKNIKGKIKAYLIRPAGITLKTHHYYFQRRMNHKFGISKWPLMIGFLALIIASFYFTVRIMVPGYSANYVEIADFNNLMNDDGSPDYFSAGMTSAVRSQLADMLDVYILEPDKGVRAPIRLEGSVQRIGDNVRIAFRLFRRKDNLQIAGGILDGPYQDIFTLQDRVIGEIAGYLADEFDLPNFRPAAIDLTSDLIAYDFYLRGLDSLKKPSTQENFDDAIGHFTSVLIHDPDFNKANTGICKAYLGNHALTFDTDLLVKAQQYCERSLATKPTVEALVMMSKVNVELGNYREAEENIKNALIIDPYDFEGLYQLAELFNVQGNIELAKQKSLELIELFPMDWRSHNLHANYLIETGLYAESILYLKDALQIIPENEMVLSNLGVAYLYIGNYEDSAAYFEQAVNLLPTGAGYSNAASIYYYAGNYTKAKELYTKARLLLPDYYPITLNLADAYRQINEQSDRAKLLYSEVVMKAQANIRLNDKDAKAYQSLALAKVYLGDIKQALNALQKAHEVGRENDLELYYSAAKVYAYLNDEVKKIESIKKLIALGYPEKLINADPDLLAFNLSPEDT